MSKKETANNDWFYKAHWMLLIPAFPLCRSERVNP